jgi:Bacterial Ig domain
VNEIPSDSDVSPAVSFCTMCAGQGHPLCEQGSSNSGSSPKPPPAPLPAPVPQDEPASPPTSPVADPPTAMVFPGPVVLPTLTSPTMDTTLVTSSNTPLVIPAIADANQTMSIADWPMHGSIAVKDDGTITYTPDTGFDGLDRFNVEICNADGRCETVAMSLTIQPASSSGGSSFNAMYLLSLLALLPIGALVLYKRQNHKADTVPALGVEPPNSDHTSQPHADAQNADEIHLANKAQKVQMNAHSLSTDTTGGSRPDAPSHQSFDDSNDVVRSQPPGERKGHEPLGREPDSARVPPPLDVMTERGILPDIKDQCRSVVSGSRGGHAAPLVTAVFIDDSVPEERDLEA